MSDLGVVWAWACGVPRVMTVGELAAVSVTLLPPGAWGFDLARACIQGGLMCEMLVAYYVHRCKEVYPCAAVTGVHVCFFVLG